MPVCVPACPCPLPLAPIQPWEEAPSPCSPTRDSPTQDLPRAPPDFLCPNNLAVGARGLCHEVLPGWEKVVFVLAKCAKKHEGGTQQLRHKGQSNWAKNKNKF